MPCRNTMEEPDEMICTDCCRMLHDHQNESRAEGVEDMPLPSRPDFTVTVYLRVAQDAWRVMWEEKQKGNMLFNPSHAYINAKISYDLAVGIIEDEARKEAAAEGRKEND